MLVLEGPWVSLGVVWPDPHDSVPTSFLRLVSSMSQEVCWRTGVCPQPVLHNTLGSRSWAGSRGAGLSLDEWSLCRGCPSMLSLLPSLAPAVLTALLQGLACGSWGGELGASQFPWASSVCCFPHPPPGWSPQPPEFPAPPPPWPQAESQPGASLDEGAFESPLLPHTEVPSSPLTCGPPGGGCPMEPKPTGALPQPGKLRMGLGGSCLLV